MGALCIAFSVFVAACYCRTVLALFAIVISVVVVATAGIIVAVVTIIQHPFQLQLLFQCEIHTVEFFRRTNASKHGLLAIHAPVVLILIIPAVVQNILHMLPAIASRVNLIVVVVASTVSLGMRATALVGIGCGMGPVVGADEEGGGGHGINRGEIIVHEVVVGVVGVGAIAIPGVDTFHDAVSMVM